MSGFRGAASTAPRGYRLREEHKDASSAHQFLGTLFHGRGLEGPLGNLYEPIPLPETRRHSFEDKYIPNTSSSREYIPPEYKGEYKSLLSDWDQPKQMGSTAVFGDPNQYFRDSMTINRGVKGATGRRRGGSGRSRGGKGGGKGNYYEDKAQGTGVHT